MKRIAHSSLALALIYLTLSFAHGQSVTYSNDDLGFRLDHPAHWDALESHEADGATTVLFTPAGDSMVAMVIAQPLSPDEQAYFMQATRNELIAEVWSGFLEEVPGAQITRTSERTVASATATVIDYHGPGIGGTLLFFTHGAIFYVLSVAAEEASQPQAQAVFEEMLSSFTLASGPEQPSSQTGNPLDPPTSDEPGNPLAGGHLPPPSDPFVGTFASEQLTLTLQRDNGHYAGQLVFGDQTFPVTAQASDGALSGSFDSGGTAFAFTASLEGEALTFFTGGTSYVLQKR